MSAISSQIRPIVAWSFRQVLGSITHVETTRPLLALTFDDGPNPDATPELLRLFKRYDARATFFTLGGALERWPEIARQAGADGHALGNHSWDHPSLLKIDRTERTAQIERTQAEIRRLQPALDSFGARLFRPPYGEQNLQSCLDVKLRGFRTIAWNVDSGDWHEADVEVMKATLAKHIGPGNIFLFHDSITAEDRSSSGASPRWLPHPDRAAMLSTIEWLLETYGKAYRFVTVHELMAAGKLAKRAWIRRGSGGTY